MEYLLLALVTVGMTMQSVSKKAYNEKAAGGVFAFSAGSVVLTMLFFVATSGGELHFTADVIWYAVAFAVANSLGVAGSMLAILTGPLSLSSLVVSYSLIISTVYGLTVLGEPIKATLLIGILLLLVSLFFINMEKKGEEKKITLKWVLFALIAFVGNGFCSVVQKEQQIKFDGLYKNEFMIIALLISAVALFILAFATEKKTVLPGIKNGFWYYTICGIANGLVNYLVLVLANTMPASVMFPVISAGGVVLAAIVSVFFYKEKLSAWQWIGFVLGTLAIVALNL